jgi:hypothetical protein
MLTWQQSDHKEQCQAWAAGVSCTCLLLQHAQPVHGLGWLEACGGVPVLLAVAEWQASIK